MITKLYNKAVVGVCYLLLLASTPFVLGSCEDFFDQEMEDLIDADQSHLNNAVDTIYSLTGVLKKLEALGDRTILLGELRGDLMDYTENADADLVAISQFNIDDNNRFNNPRDYYAVINNCNYFIENADTALKNNRNEYIFMREYAAIKAIRAWTYLQLVLNYGSVPFVTKPILTKEDADATYPTYDLQSICTYFINDLAPLSPLYGNNPPQIGTIQGVLSRYFYYPVDVILGDLHLWAGGAVNARQAALYYYKYISEHNGSGSIYPTGTDRVAWDVTSSTRLRPTTDTWGSSFSGRSERTYSATNNELITTIAGDSLPSETYYSQLRNYFNSLSVNDYKPKLTASTGISEISEAQEYCTVTGVGKTVTYEAKGRTNHRSGDLRLWSAFTSSENVTVTYSNGQTDRIDNYQQMYKWDSGSRDVPILRRQMVYLRMAEALNLAGYPHMAFAILSTGLNNDIIRDSVEIHYPQADTLYLRKFDFLSDRNHYALFTADHLVGNSTTSYNTMGMHSRGSGWTPLNAYYRIPNDTIETDATKQAQLISEQMAYVDSLILQEGALEFAFEGVRFYDLMRYALRQPNPGKTMQYYVFGRRGKANRAAMAAEIKKDLTDQRNWYLNYKGDFGLKTLVPATTQQ